MEELSPASLPLTLPLTLTLTQTLTPQASAAARVAAVEVASLLAISSGELPALVGGGAGGEARAAVLAEAAAPGAELEAEAGSELEVVVLFAGRDGSPLALSSCAGLTPSSSS